MWYCAYNITSHSQIKFPMKTLIIFLFFVIFCATGIAQETKYGVKAGLTVSNLDFDGSPIIDNKHRNGFVFGVFVDYGITENFSIVPELQYSGEGANASDFRNDYLNFPVIFKYNIFGNVSLGVGPQVGLKIHKDNDGFRNFVFATVGYFEYAITDEFAIDARYNYGLSNVFDSNLTPEATNGVIQFGINYKL